MEEETERGKGGGGEVVLQFGRVGADSFSCDFSFPLSPVQGEWVVTVWCVISSIVISNDVRYH